MKQRKEMPRTELRRVTPLKRTAMPRTSGPVKPRKTKNTGPRKSIKDLVKDRAAIDTLDGLSLCEICGQRPGTNMHHRQPRQRGGCKLPYINQPTNLMWLCGWGNSIDGCHRDVELNRSYAKSVFWLVPRPLKPAELPVLRRGSFVWLYADGSFEPLDLIELAEWAVA